MKPPTARLVPLTLLLLALHAAWESPRATGVAAEPKPDRARMPIRMVGGHERPQRVEPHDPKAIRVHRAAPNCWHRSSTPRGDSRGTPGCTPISVPTWASPTSSSTRAE